MATASPKIPTGAAGASEHSRRQYLDAIREQARRNLESLRLYRPLKFQDSYHRCTAREAILQKGNQVGGPEKFDEPVLMADGTWSRICDLRVGDSIIGGDGSPCRVTGVQDVGILPCFNVQFDDGAETICALNHPWKCQLTKTERFKSHPNYKPEKWGVRTLLDIIRHGGYEPTPRDRAVIPVCSAEFPESSVPLDPYALGALLGDGSFTHTGVSLTTGDDEIAEEVTAMLADSATVVEDSRKLLYRITGLVHDDGKRYGNQVIAALRLLGLMGHRGESKFVPDCYKRNSASVRLSVLQGLMDTDGYANLKGTTQFYTSSPQLAQDVVDIVRSLGGKAHIKWRTTEVRSSKVKKKGRPRIQQADPNLFSNECLNMAVVWLRLPTSCPFRLPRKIERWRKHGQEETTGRVMTKIETIGNYPCFCIQVDSHDHTYVTRDFIVTHNSLCGFVEDARAAMGCDPYNKYPKTNGVVACLGFGEKHIGRVMHKYLFRPGAFRIIRDEFTRQWRVYRPWPNAEEVGGEKGDLERKDQSREAEPLIPERMIKDISWDKRSDYVFSRVELINGWQIYAYNTAGDPGQAQGWQAHLVHIDEDTASPGWHIEMMNRISMTEGLLRWTALPHMKNDELMGMIERAEDEAGSAAPTTVLFRATVYDNPFYPRSSREANEKIFKSMGEDVYRRRMLGDIITDKVAMYPAFSTHLHEAIKQDEPRLQVQKILTDNNGDPPRDWCCYAIIDPGHTICAVTFFCVPPPEKFGDFKIQYDELYIANCESKILTRNFKHKTQDRVFEEFIIDGHGANLTGISDGVSPNTQYRADFEKAGIVSVKTGSGFRYGSDDIPGRTMALRNWLSIRDDGSTKFLIVTARCPNTVTEFKRFKKKTHVVNGVQVILDEGERRNVHAVECCEYAAAHGLPYVKPRSKSTAKTWLDRVLEHRAAYDAKHAAANPKDKSIRLGPQ